MTASSSYNTYSRKFSPDSISGLIIDLDARDVAVGAITSWTDRKNKYTLTGNATRDSQMNGYPSVTFNGTTDRLYTTSNAITQINGSTATTTVVVMKDTLTANGAQGFVCGLSNSSVTLLSNIWVVGPSTLGGDPSAAILNQSFGNVGSNFRYFASNNASPGVLSCVVDFSEAGASEASTIRYNGQVPSILVPSGPYSQDNTGTFPSMDVLLGSWNSGTYPWPGSITKLLIYNRRLTTAEMEYLERGVSKLGGFNI